ncbi:aspartyl-phosphate phosphatase Spo0E family protein [Brevibacillus dissolubilis]|uniref:aspartyl-phosphate phosphatase Spo0E family protein n=1 Tax=Brevibacillus dissolubilis TaxID=1844116 RepID=UPI0011163D9C|nr:aspartyl-phosphate phosphatase Spo0E family protein [Brevibacillus dissolubilis]
MERKPIEKRIEELRRHLESAAREAGYNFLDPYMIEVSQQLDQLMVAHMQTMKRP